MITKFWNKIITIGVNNSLPPELKRQIIITNQYIIACSTAILIKAFYNLFIHELFVGTMLLCLPLFLLVSLLLNKYKKYEAASFIPMFATNLILFYFSSYRGFDAGVYLYYFPFLVGIAMLFELNSNRKQFVIHFLLATTSLIILSLTKNKLFFTPGLDEEIAETMHSTNFIISIVLLAYYILIINRANKSINVHLENIINQKKETETRLKTSLTDKNTLLSEVHHRVKNNLAIVTSLLSLKMESVNNSFTKQVLLECRNRVMSMSLIHEKLYRTKNFSSINIKIYIKELIDEIEKSYPVESNSIVINVSSPDIYLDLSTAIPCGLLLNELVTNSYKHAFKEIEKGEINISVVKKDDEIEIVFSDNGIGFDLSTTDTHSLGLILIESLTEQLSGKCAFIFNEGTKFVLSFPLQEK